MDRPIVKQVMKGDNFQLEHIFHVAPLYVDWVTEKTSCVLKNHIQEGRRARINGYCCTDFDCKITLTGYYADGQRVCVNYIIQTRFADNRDRAQILLGREGINEFPLCCEDGQPLAYENRNTN
jgi:hypothetical protein